jgi:hypothetical protein
MGMLTTISTWLVAPAGKPHSFAIRAFYESCLWILQTLLLTHPDLHPGLLAEDRRLGALKPPSNELVPSLPPCCPHRNLQRTCPFRSSETTDFRSASGGAIQFPGGSCTRWSPAPFTADWFNNYERPFCCV